MDKREKIIELLDNQGPLTGKELLEKIRIDEFSAWKICNSSERVVTKTIGTRYLRLDRQVEGYARLSPSIIREFYGYTVIGTEKNIHEIHMKAELLHQEIKEISKKKFELAQNVITKIVESQEASQIIKTGASFIIAGDVAYEMSHLEPRPEASTGELVKGSDLDIVVVTQGLPDSIINALDLAIYDQKNFLLKNPSYNEEIDYIIKDISKVKEQLKFNNFKSMVASKILYEGKFLYGNFSIFKQIRKMLIDEGIPEKIRTLEEKALINRNNARTYLLNYEGSKLTEEENMKLFYTKEEKEEFF
ncbi:hypothetical protein [Desulfolucanica intricata]|uniref:hypothetical protein n=1 Tax=Desulfolucanica intricata TaxID=1285191 RepID=UPI00082DF2B6|nr:hypothetical protein [Desulfolucanica intricata]